MATEINDLSEKIQVRKFTKLNGYECTKSLQHLDYRQRNRCFYSAVV